MPAVRTHFTPVAGHGTLEPCLNAQARMLTKSRPKSLPNSGVNRSAVRTPQPSPSVDRVGLRVARHGLKSSPKHSARGSHARLPRHAGRCKELPEAISSVPYWGMLVHPKDGHSKVFCVLHAYLDDSGSHAQAPILILAGYYGSENQWKKFDLQWRKAIDSEGLREFHANRFWAHYRGD